ncbi:polysaccharide lyase [Niabella sp. CC-SYL272]|uniref:heparin lyase I family protein n=1 Tax=Niabella agricola TaxID=2891571 RepID=UPI001F42DBF8|nr:heparin lyase I family protein [Niabella agricola]MCF3110031.1 polysaccharide lyase [Niabella agricola]
MNKRFAAHITRISMITAMLFFATTGSVFSQVVGKTILNIDYENGTANSGIPEIEPTSAPGADAVYMVSPGASGNYATAHKVVYGDSAYYSDGNWRSESAALQYLPARFAPGMERRYEFSVLLKDWTPWNTGDPINETNFFQLKVSGGQEVPLQVRTQRNVIRLRYNDAANGVSTKDILNDLRPYVNQWIRFRIDAKWALDATGYIRTYMKLPGQPDYILADEKTGYITFPGDGGNIGYIKWGVYVVPPDITRIIYHDDIRILELSPPPAVSRRGLLWGNSIPDANPGYLDGPYTRAANITDPAAYSNTGNTIYIDPGIQYTPSQNIVYFNSSSPAPGAGDNVEGSPSSDFSRATLTASGATGTPLTPGPGGRYLVNGFNIGTTGSPTPIDLGEYYEFKLSPVAGYTIHFDSIVFSWRRGTTTAPNTFALRSSVDGFSSNISAPVTINNAAGATTVTKYDLSALTGVTQPIILRMYWYGSTAGGSGNSVGLEAFQFYGETVSNIALPAALGSIEAVLQGEGLVVNWQSLRETHNSYFEIQASKDGQHFTTIKTVHSKNGYASTSQSYKASITANEMAALTGLPLFFGFLVLGAHKRSRSKQLLLLLLVAAAIASCNKYHDALSTSQQDPLFVRIKQVDQDGKATYSKVVTVTKTN